MNAPMQAITHTTMDLSEINRELADKTPQEIIAWALQQEGPIISTTSFGINAAVMLHLVAEQARDLPVVWVDTGYNLRDTYVIAQRLIDSLNLKMSIFTPEITSERRNAIMGGIPTIEEEDLHQEFTRQVKLEPFARALAAHSPKVWLTGLRKEETEFRKTLDIVTLDQRGILKVAPIFKWTESDMNQYMQANSLPSCKHYFDPTKVHDGRECGLHTSA